VSATVLAFVPRTPLAAVVAPPVDRGRLLTPAQVAALIGGVSAAWVRRTVPGKIRLGHSTVRYYEHDVRAWIASCAQRE
jgi:predicted DNA-binding transcriptional regulator AlpA